MNKAVLKLRPFVFLVLSLALRYSVFSQCNSSLIFQTGSTKATVQEVDSYIPDTNYANTWLVFAEQWTVNSVPTEFRGLIKYDLSQIPAGSIVSNALLSLYADTASADGRLGQPTYGDSNASYIKRILSPWTRSGVTWNNQPPTTEAGEVLLPQSTSTDQDYSAIDITPFVQTWVDSPSVNYGMMLQMITQSYYNSLIFCGTYFPDSTKWPKLTVCYTSSTGILLTNSSYGEMKVFPNPLSGGRFELVIPENFDAQKTVLNVYNILGAKVEFKIVQKKPNLYLVDLPTVSPGTYMVELKNSSERKCTKLIVTN